MAASFVLAENETSQNTTSTNQTSNSTNTTSNSTSSNQTKTNRTAFNEMQCLKRLEGVNSILGNHTNARDNNIKHFSKAAEGISKFADRMEGEGYNVTKLREDLVIFNSMINNTRADYNIFFQKLAEVRKHICQSSGPGLRNSLREAQKQMEIIRNDTKNLKNYFREVIQKDAKEIKKERKEDKKEAKKERREEKRALKEEKKEQKRQAKEQKKQNKTREGANNQSGNSSEGNSS